LSQAASSAARQRKLRLQQSLTTGVCCSCSSR
jgi:hypothetical protein